MSDPQLTSARSKILQCSSLLHIEMCYPYRGNQPDRVRQL